MESQVTYICSQDVKEEKKEIFKPSDEILQLLDLFHECSLIEENEEAIYENSMTRHGIFKVLSYKAFSLWKQKNMFNSFKELYSDKLIKLYEACDEFYYEHYRAKVLIPPTEQKEIISEVLTKCINNEKFDKFYMDLYEIQKIAQADGFFEWQISTAFKRFWLNFKYLMAQVRHMRIMTRLKNNGLDKLTLDKISEVLNPGNMKITRFGTYVRGLTADMANELFKVGYRVIPRDNEPAKEEVIIMKIEEEDKFDTTYHEDFVKEMLGIKKKEQSKMETDKSNFEIEEENEGNEKQEKEAENFENEFKKMLADIAHDETIPF